VSDWWGLSGSRVLVVGAGGLGLGCMRAFADAGSLLAVIDISPERLANSRAEIAGIHTLRADVAEPESARRAVADAAAKLGQLDVLVHAVGVNVRLPIIETSDENWRSMLETNLSSAFYLGQAAGRTMVEQGHGRIIFVSSVAGLLAHKAHGAYAATKGGLNQLMRVMAHEWADRGVTVNAVAPGYTETDLTSEHLARPGVRAQLTSLVPEGRLGTIDDIVGPVLFLASEKSSFVTGHVLYVDGGRTLL
jgi:gluconate 5-dehydrogenase